jgi:membrane protease YdiL (CAAX protease family)
MIPFFFTTHDKDYTKKFKQALIFNYTNYSTLIWKETNMENYGNWKAKTGFLCYLTIAAGIIMGSLMVSILIFGLGLDLHGLSFPLALISLPITEGLIFIITFLFSKYEGASLRELGLKKPNIKIMVFVSFAAVLLLLLAGSISLVEEIVLGPEPEAELLIEALLPRDSLQLIALIGISLALVGPVEELAFRGFVQKGFENSFGKTAGLVIASILFGILHGLNSLQSILPVTVVSLFLGYIWQKTDGNTTASAWTHGLYDALAIGLTYFAFS